MHPLICWLLGLLRLPYGLLFSFPDFFNISILTAVPTCYLERLISLFDSLILFAPFVIITFYIEDRDASNNG